MRTVTIGLSALATLLFSTTARAQPVICEIRDTDPTSGAFEPHCGEPVFCAAGDDCADTGFADPVCGTALTDLPNVCRPRCGTVLGCAVDGDCRAFRDNLGTCRLTEGGDPPFGVCAYPGLGATYCTTGSLDPMRFAACHTRIDGSPTSNYFEGNCDGDGCPNGGDAMPCLFDRAPCTPLDLTISCSTAPLPVDGGMALLDAGVPSSRDAGASDAGVVEPFDGGPPVDAPEPVRASFGGGGGVRCSAAPGTQGPPLALVAVAVALRCGGWAATRVSRQPRGITRARSPEPGSGRACAATSSSSAGANREASGARSR